MPVKKSARSKASATAKKPATSRASSKKSKPQFSAGTMLIAAMCVAGAVIAIAAHEMTPTARVASEMQREEVSLDPTPAATTMKADNSAAAATPPTETNETSSTSVRR